MLTYGFDVLKLERIVALTHSSNIACTSLLASIGMRLASEVEIDGMRLELHSIASDLHETLRKQRRGVAITARRESSNCVESDTTKSSQVFN